MMEHFNINRCEGFQAIFMNWTVDQPGFRPATFDAVSEALRDADRDPNISCSVFFGVPRCFCLGTDVSAFAQLDELSKLSETVLTFFRALINAKKPLIAGVDGPAIGLGMTMLCHFDAIFATPGSIFKAPFAEWGLSPEAASSILLPEELGYRKAFEIFCLGGELSAAEAERSGLITRVVARTELRSTAFDAAARIVRLPPRALSTTRELLRHQRVKLTRRAMTETAIFQELLCEPSTQKRLKIMARATKMALSAQVHAQANRGSEPPRPSTPLDRVAQASALNDRLSRNKTVTTTKE
jgi:enoyl-CoA hydratase/carnithine racemase